MSKIITTSSNKTIEVFDGLFSSIEREHFFNFVRGSFYEVTGCDNYDEQEESLKNQIYCNYNEQNVTKMGILQSPFFREKVLSKYPINVVQQARVNVSNCFEYNVPHHDATGEKPPKYTLLYYCNLSWQIEWAGQTLFFADEKCQDVEYCSLFIPGRLIVFDSSIMHTIVTPTAFAKQHRFSFVIQYR